jgi:glucose-1-phosphate thymidylyltransferase
MELSVGKLVGVIPAAGRGSRLGRLPCSKELFPLGYEEAASEASGYRSHVVGQFVLDEMLLAGAKKVFMIIGPGKSDIMEFFGDGRRFGVDIAYLFQERLSGMPTALDLLSNWIGDDTVLFGMPDTIVQPAGCLRTIVSHHVEVGADLTLGLFPTNTPERFGMVDIVDGLPARVVDKPATTELTHMWGLACWSGRFTSLLHEYVSVRSERSGELLLGDAFQIAIDRALVVDAVKLEGAEYLDVGTPNDLLAAVDRLGSGWYTANRRTIQTTQQSPSDVPIDR